MTWAIIIFIVAFIGSFVACMEVINLSALKLLPAAFWGTLNSACGFLCVFIIVIEMDLWLIFPYVLGEVSASVMAVTICKRSR